MVINLATRSPRPSLKTLTCFVWLVLCIAVSTVAAQTEESERFPSASSKKGLQVEDVQDAITLGVQHATFNFAVSSLLVTSPRADDVLWEHDGNLYRLNSHYLESQDRRIREMTDAGALVYLILLNFPSGLPSDSPLIHPGFSPEAPNGIGAFNTSTERGRRTFAALMSFLSEHFCKPSDGPNRWPNGRVVGFIIGNEVNSHWWWYNMGQVTLDEFVRDYERTMRIAHLAVREHSGWPRVYISLEHHWTVRFSGGAPLRSFAGRDFLDRFAAAARSGGDYAWHIAFHPYPENLFEPKFWNGTQAIDSQDSPKVTFKNLSVLTDYLVTDELLWDGNPRSLILSEQGFHTPAGADGELVQAAAYCYAYRIADALPLVDAFILHRHVDHPREGGLQLGLWKYDAERGTRSTRKRSYEVFRAADTPRWKREFEFALPIVGRSDWKLDF